MKTALQVMLVQLLLESFKCITRLIVTTGTVNVKQYQSMLFSINQHSVLALLKQQF